MQDNLISILTVEQGKRFTLTLVDSVDSFSDSCIALTVQGKKVVVAGTHLKILSFSKGNGNFSASGEVSSVKYGGGKKRIGSLFQ